MGDLDYGTDPDRVRAVAQAIKQSTTAASRSRSWSAAATSSAA
jgi:hypothetical protein